MQTSKLGMGIISCVFLLSTFHGKATASDSDLQAGTGSVLDDSKNAVSINLSTFETKETKNIVFILDASKGDQDLKDAVANLLVAKELINNTINSVPSHMRFGLRIYGSEPNPLSQGRNTRLVVPLGANKKQIQKELKSLEMPEDCYSPFAFALSEVLQRDLAKVRDNTLLVILSNGQVDQTINLKTSNDQNFPPVKIFILNLGKQKNQRHGLAKLRRLRPELAELHSCIEPISYLKALASSANGDYFEKSSANIFLREMKKIR